MKSPVEEVLIKHVEKIKEANKLPDLEKTYDFLIENWFMFDAHWLAMVRHMKENGRLR